MNHGRWHDCHGLRLVGRQVTTQRIMAEECGLGRKAIGRPVCGSADTTQPLPKWQSVAGAEVEDASERTQRPASAGLKGPTNPTRLQRRPALRERSQGGTLARPACSPPLRRVAAVGDVACRGVRASIHTGIDPVILDQEAGRARASILHVSTDGARPRRSTRPVTRERTACGCRSGTCASHRSSGSSPRVSPASRVAGPPDGGGCGRSPRRLESRLVLDGSAATTYTWTALGDGTSFNDPNNWSHVGPVGGGVGVHGRPSLGSNLVFPPVSWLPANSPTTINFNADYGGLPVQPGPDRRLVHLHRQWGLRSTAGSSWPTPPSAGPPTRPSSLTGVTLGRQATIYTQQGSTLNLGNATNPTGVPAHPRRADVTKGGGGQLVIDTQTDHRSPVRLRASRRSRSPAARSRSAPRWTSPTPCSRSTRAPAWTWPTVPR